MLEIGVAETRERARIVRDAVRRGRVRQDPRVGAAGHRDAVEGVADAEHVLERARHRPAAGAAGEHKRAVDVEENECGVRRARRGG